MHADLGIALAKQAWLARSRPAPRRSCRRRSMPAAVSAYLDGCPIVDVPGRCIRSTCATRRACRWPRRCRPCLRERAGQVLCFLPGAGEIARARASETAATRRRGRRAPRLARRGGAGRGDRARRRAGGSSSPPTSPKRRSRFRASRRSSTPGCTKSRATIPTAASTASRPSASPRTRPISGRAAPAGSGPAWRSGCGTRPIACAPHREPEIQRVDLSGTVLDILAWGGDPRSFDWFEAPAAGPRGRGVRAARAARRHERRAADRRRAPDAAASRSTPGCRRSCSPPTARARRPLACALLSERHYQAGRRPALASDHDERSAERRRARTRSAASTCSGRRALLQSLVDGPARPDDRRVAVPPRAPRRLSRPRGRRRAPGSPRVLLSSGHGAVVGPESGVRDGEFLVALDVMAGRPGEGAEARIRMASTVERSWLTPTHTRVDHAFDRRCRASCAPCRATTTTRWSSSSARRRPIRSKSRACWSTPTCRSRCPMRTNSCCAALRFAGLARRRSSAGRSVPRAGVRALRRPRHRAGPHRRRASAARSDGAADDWRSERTRGAARVSGGWVGQRGGEAAGAVRPRRHAPRRPQARARFCSRSSRPTAGPSR